MYREYLELALRELEAAHRGLTGAALDAALEHDLEDRRRTLIQIGPRPDPPSAIAAQATYDAALVLLCRGRSIEVDLARFTDPQLAREELRSALSANCRVSLAASDTPSTAGA